MHTDKNDRFIVFVRTRGEKIIFLNKETSFKQFFIVSSKREKKLHIIGHDLLLSGKKI